MTQGCVAVNGARLWYEEVGAQTGDVGTDLCAEHGAPG